jgi:uncharacterized protein (DUF2147 family)
MLVLALLLLSRAGVLSATVAGGAILGTWLNSNDTVAVHVAACGALICGTVIHASPQSEADARKGGVAHLVGTRVLRDFQQSGEGSWKGTLFVPERDRTLRSTLIMQDRDHITVQGCILAGLLCGHEVWHRVPRSRDGPDHNAS